MSRYAVKIGEIRLCSDEPITDEQRKKAMREINENVGLLYTEDGLQVEYALAIDRH